MCGAINVMCYSLVVQAGALWGGLHPLELVKGVGV